MAEHEGAGQQVLCVPVLRGGDQPEMASVMRFLAQAHVAGVGLDWAAVLAPWGPSRVALPTYAFQRQRFWLSGPAGVGDVSVGFGSLRAWFVGGGARGAGVGWGGVDRGVVAGAQPWLADHAVGGVVLFPGRGLWSW